MIPCIQSRPATAMAPDITEKKTKNCSKKYAYSAHSKYSKWEKDRRDRFNSKLEELAECLPNYNKDNPWKKVEIIENAILTITTGSVSQNKVSEDTIRKLSNEVNNLKSVILQFTGFSKSSEDIYRVTSHDISSILSEIAVSEKAQQEDSILPVQVVASPEKTDKSLAFVAKIAQSNDHCYSMNVSEQISGEVEVVESEVGVQDKAGPQLAKVVGIVETVETLDSNSPDETCCLTLVQDGSVVELPQLISFEEQTAPVNCASNVRTIFVNETPRPSPSVLFQPPPPPPPPVIAEIVDNGRLVNKIAIPRLRLEKKKKKVRKTYTRTKPFVKSVKKDKRIKVALQNALKDKNIFNKENPDEADDPLINKEEIELLEETLKEDTEKTEKAALSKDKKISTGDSAKRKLESLSKKKSKSSYSIAALCQISVNIGDRPEIANSPGVIIN